MLEEMRAPLPGEAGRTSAAASSSARSSWPSAPTTACRPSSTTSRQAAARRSRSSSPARSSSTSPRRPASSCPGTCAAATRSSQWLMWQMGGLGPMAGQAHHFLQYAPEKIPYAHRPLHEGGQPPLRRARTSGSRTASSSPATYSIADMAAFPWVVALPEPGPEARGLLPPPALVRGDEGPPRRAARARRRQGSRARPPGWTSRRRRSSFGQHGAEPVAEVARIRAASHRHSASWSRKGSSGPPGLRAGRLPHRRAHRSDEGAGTGRRRPCPRRGVLRLGLGSGPE